MHRIKKVKPLENYELLIEFENGEKRVKDMKPYLDKGVFSKLKNKNFFNTVKVSYGTICWGENIDLCSDNIYITSSIYKK